MAEFYRMCDEFGWERGDEDREEAHGLLKDALTKQFNTMYGTEEDSMDSWQKLCRALNITPMPETLHACRKEVMATHVNLVDLVDRGMSHKRVKIFPSENALSEYTLRNGKFFPKENAYAGGLLRHLLRHILNPNSSR